MTNVLIAGERIDLIAEAFRGMQARRDADGWISVTGRLERVPGEALMRALQRVETELPRRIGTTRDEHRAAALDEIARQLDATRPPTRNDDERAEKEREVRAIDAAVDRFTRREGERHLKLVQ
jgi:predicted ribosome quality control (RQC) complex YloA/Tae2 family protein